MAKLTVNGLFVDKLSGRHGDAMVVNRLGRMFTSRIGKQPHRAPSEGQKFVHNRFKLANGYASGVLREPTKRAYYEMIAKSRRTTTFGQAMGDFLRPPEITLFELGVYEGKIGDKISLLATDDTGVASVHVTIRSAANVVLEHGEAAYADQTWTYTGTTNLPIGQPVTIEAAAHDRPGNITTMQKPFTAA